MSIYSDMISREDGRRVLRLVPVIKITTQCQAMFGPEAATVTVKDGEPWIANANGHGRHLAEGEMAHLIVNCAIN